MKVCECHPRGLTYTEGPIVWCLKCGREVIPGSQPSRIVQPPPAPPVEKPAASG